MLLHGRNGSGKTNLLEALHLGTQGFSPRARRDATMIRFGTDTARVALDGSVGANRFATSVVLTKADTRRVELNGERLGSADRLRTELATLVFTPDRLAVVKAGPATRRAYVDRAIGRLYPARSTLPAEYASALGQRNAGLRRIRAGMSTRDALEPWTERVTARGRDLVEARAEVVALLAPLFERIAADIGLEEASLAYEGEPPTASELANRLEADLERGVTGIGPHLHDLRITAGGRELRTYGSQGEQRTAVLALVLAEADALSGRHGVSPLVLMDDVLSELDGERRRALAGMLERCAQSVVTATAAAALPVEPAQVLTVTPGEVR